MVSYKITARHASSFWQLENKRVTVSQMLKVIVIGRESNKLPCPFHSSV